MNPEELLEQLVEMRSQGPLWHPEDMDDLNTRLQAADTLRQTQQVKMPSPDLTRKVEARVRAHAQLFSQRNQRMSGWTALRFGPNAGLTGNQRGWIAFLGIAGLLLLLVAGILGASSRSLPGDPLYGVRQAQYQLLLTMTKDPLDRATASINELNSSVTNLNSVVNEGRNTKTIDQALQIVETQTHECKTTVATVAAGPAQVKVQQQLDQTLTAEKQTLSVLLPHVNWSLQIAFTQQLGVVGVTVIWVKEVHLSTQSGGAILLTVTGGNFAPHAKLFINGQPIGQVSQSSATRLIVSISASARPYGTFNVGIRNPDGMAAQLRFQAGNLANPPAVDDQPRKNGPSIANKTPISGDDHGRHGNGGDG